MSAVRRWRSGPLWPVLSVGLVSLAVAGCGSDDNSSSGTSSSAAKSTSSPSAATTATAPAGYKAVPQQTGGSKSPIKIAVMSECKGAFGSFDNQDMAGAITALAQFAGAKPSNPNKPRAGWTGGAVGGHPLKLVGVGCGDDTSDTAIKEVRRLMEQDGADMLIGPLSGDESIAVANYAKQHPDKTFVNGAAGAQDTTLKVRAPNFFRFNGDGAQFNAGLGELAYKKLGWRKAAVIMDDYSFGWTSGAGFIADFCAAGGQVVKRVFPPLNTTDYSSFAQQLPTDVDGTFVAVGGAGLIPFLKAYEQAHGPIDSKKFIGNVFWGTPSQFEQLGPRVSGAYAGGAGTAGDLDTPEAQYYANNMIGKWFKTIPPGGAAAPQASSVFTYSFFVNTWGLIEGLNAVKGDISGGQKALQQAIAKVTLNAPYGKVTLDDNRQAVTNQYYLQLVTKDGKLATKTTGEVPDVDQTFGGTFSNSTPAPGRKFPPCAKKSLPWAGKTQTPKLVSG
jgi:branched-chain amino acid transport system substrate-binding protein